MPRCEDEREEQRKAARLSLDTSAHASLEYHKILQQCSSSPVSLSPNLMSRSVPLCGESMVELADETPQN